MKTKIKHKLQINQTNDRAPIKLNKKPQMKSKKKKKGHQWLNKDHKGSLAMLSFKELMKTIKANNCYGRMFVT